MRTIEERVARLERLLSRNLFTGADNRTMIPEPEVIQRFGIGRERLKQLRLGYKGSPPVLRNWTSVKGRRIEYDINELARVLKREKKPGLSRVMRNSA